VDYVTDIDPNSELCAARPDCSIALFHLGLDGDDTFKAVYHVTRMPPPALSIMRPKVAEPAMHAALMPVGRLRKLIAGRRVSDEFTVPVCRVHQRELRRGATIAEEEDDGCQC